MYTLFLSMLLSLMPATNECAAPVGPTDEATPVLECGAPLCITIKEGLAHTAACDTNCGTWTPGAAVTCGDIVCQPSGQPSECRWVCRPSADW